MIITCLKCNRHVDTGTAVPGDVVTCRCGLGLMVPEGPAAAGKMNCPACGAPVDPDLAKCNYCDTKLATVMCPKCFGAVFDGVKHCPHCGEALSDRMVIHHGDETEHKCPRCGEELRIEVVAGAPLERCPACEGLWVDRETAERLYKNREQADPVRKMTKPKGPPRQEVDTKKVKKEGYIKCPVCQNIMNRQNFGRYSGVIIDVCMKHGTWFDADELRRILDFIAAGGLDKAARREKEKLEDEIRRLKSRRMLGGDHETGAFGGASAFSGRLNSERSALGLVGTLFRTLLK